MYAASASGSVSWARRPTAKKAIALANELKPDGRLLGLAMPRVLGMEVLRELAHQEVVSKLAISGAGQAAPEQYLRKARRVQPVGVGGAGK